MENKEELKIGDSVYVYGDWGISEFVLETENNNLLSGTVGVVTILFKKKLKDGKIISKSVFNDNITKLVLKTDETKKIFDNDVKRFELIEELNNTDFKHLNDKELDNILKIVNNERNNDRFRSV